MNLIKLFQPILALIIFSSAVLTQQVWRENSFEDFSDGTFDDAGANMYVSHNGRVQTINRWDVNDDGNVDMLCVNSHSLVEMLDMSIYWGNGKDFSIQNHSYIPANGPMWATADDLNSDGEMDLIVANYSNGTWTDMDSFVYYGGLDKNKKLKEGEWGHYPFKERVLLPSSNAQKAISGDFNNDGYKDIVIAFSGGFWEYRDKSKDGTSPSRIYWGGDDEFKADRFTNIMTAGATDVVSADFNNDGWIDLVFANGNGESSFIYYGNEDGYTNKRLIKLPTIKAHAVEVGDIDNNGTTDVIFACEKGLASYAYLNIKGSFSAKKRIIFETFTAKDVVAADFNNDGFTDIFFTNHQFSLSGNPKLANRLIDSYIYFGSSKGFKNENRQSIQTIGAWGANAADLNMDGWIDLVISNFQEHYSYEVPSFIYWNSPQGFQQTMRTPLYEHGAQGNTIADLNGDGFLDVLINSMMGNSRGDYDPSYLYYGQSDGGFNANDRIELPGREAYEQAFADLDDDGDVDILLANRGEITRLANEVWIYWNEDNKFDSWNMSGLSSQSALGVQIADLDKNGYLDIIISNGSPRITDGKKIDGTYLYWGSKNGWPVTERTVLPTGLTRAATVCDINSDGHLDLIFGNQMKGALAAIYYGDGTRNYSADKRMQFSKSEGTGNPGVADLNKDGLLDIAFAHSKNIKIYYQKKNGNFDEPIIMPVQAKTMTIGDVNNDGWLDLVCPYYKGNGKRTWYSTVLLGNTNGYDVDKSIKLPTNGGTGSLVCDYNRDGYNDIFFYCHREDGSFDEIKKYGDHHVNSVLYWGSVDGFSNENIEELPSVGAHYDMGVDIGNINDRTTKYFYASSPYKTNGKDPISLKWEGEAPHYSSLKFQLRSADSEKSLHNTEWSGPSGSGSYYTDKNNTLIDISGEWIQYRALFNTGNGANTPVLNSVEITFEK
jgi:hypothetical protein